MSWLLSKTLPYNVLSEGLPMVNGRSWRPEQLTKIINEVSGDEVRSGN